MALPIGTILDGKFKIVQVLGEGGMGTVYKVEQVGMPSYVYAVKELLINPSTSEEDRKAAIERFNKEIALLRGLKHQHIPSLMLPFQERGNYYFVMEFVPGRSLEKMLEDNNRPLDEEQVIKWMIQVCDALSYIHSRTPPIILRDLKPGNIMVTPSGEVQLIDFGIARRFDPNKRTNTENLGTISYASPEHLGSITAPGQRRSAQNPGRLVQTDARSDIYSLGATMYHLLTNYEPDPIQTPTPGSILAKNPRLHREVEQVIIKAMQQDSAQRFQSADAMRTALQHCLPGAPATIYIPAVSPSSTIIVPVSGLICPKCGYQNRPGAKFCKRDGQPLRQGVTAAPPQGQPRVQAAPRQPIQARPVQQPIQPRPVPQPIRARPVQQPVQPRPTPIQARPVSVSAPPASDPGIAYRLGLQYLNSKNYTEAVNQVKLCKPSYDVLYNLGRAYRQYGQSVKDKDKKLFQENMKLAAEQFEEATKYKQDAMDAYFQLGMSYHDLELCPRAEAAFKKALQISPKDSAIYYQLGLIAIEQGYNREAEADFLEGLKINPDHVLILISLGRLYVKMRQVSSAISTLRQATQRDPAIWEGWYALGRAHMAIKEWSQALSALAQGQQWNPDAAEIYSAMSLCYLKAKKKAEARQMVREALQRDPNNAEAIGVQKQL